MLRNSIVNIYYQKNKLFYTKKHSSGHDNLHCHDFCKNNFAKYKTKIIIINVKPQKTSKHLPTNHMYIVISLWENELLQFRARSHQWHNDLWTHNIISDASTIVGKPAFSKKHLLIVATHFTPPPLHHLTLPHHCARSRFLLFYRRLATRTANRNQSRGAARPDDDDGLRLMVVHTDIRPTW